MPDLLSQKRRALLLDVAGPLPQEVLPLLGGDLEVVLLDLDRDHEAEEELVLLEEASADVDVDGVGDVHDEDVQSLL